MPNYNTFPHHVSDDRVNARRRYPRVITARTGDGLTMCAGCFGTIGSDVEQLGIDHGPGKWVIHVCGPCAVKCGFVTEYWPRPRPPEVMRPKSFIRQVFDRARGR